MRLLLTAQDLLTGPCQNKKLALPNLRYGCALSTAHNLTVVPGHYKKRNNPQHYVLWVVRYVLTAQTPYGVWAYTINGTGPLRGLACIQNIARASGDATSTMHNNCCNTAASNNTTQPKGSGCAMYNNYPYG